MKICTKCHCELDESLFNKRSGSRDGLRSQCKVCRALYKHQHYQEHKAIYIEQHKEWRNKNPDKKREMARRWNDKIAIGKEN